MKLNEAAKYIALFLLILVLLISCDEGPYKPFPIPEDNEPIPSINVIYIPSEKLNKYLKNEINGKFEFKMGEEIIDSLEAGDIIISDSGMGFLRKVTAVEIRNSTKTIHTKQAALTEVFEKVKIDWNISLTKDNIKSSDRLSGVTIRSSDNFPLTIEFEEFVIYDEDENNSTKDDMITCSGLIKADIKMYSGFKISNGKIDSAYYNISGKTETELIVKPKINDNINTESQFLKISFLPAIELVDSLPVVFTPEINAKIALDGKCFSGYNEKIKQTHSFEYCLNYSMGKWQETGEIAHINELKESEFEPVSTVSFVINRNTILKLFGVDMFSDSMNYITNTEIHSSSGDAYYSITSFTEASFSEDIAGDGIFSVTKNEIINDTKWIFIENIHPEVLSVNPLTVRTGGILTITGEKFGYKKYGDYVSFNGLIPDDDLYISWTDKEIKVRVPQDAVSGKVWVVVSGIASTKVDITIDNEVPVINSITPANQAPGDAVTISGENFGSVPGDSKLTFGEEEAEQIISWTETQIRVNIPKFTEVGDVYVILTVDGASSEHYIYTTSPGENNLFVDVTPKNVQANPGDSETFSINISDHNGNPINDAEVFIYNPFEDETFNIGISQYGGLLEYNFSIPSDAESGQYEAVFSASKAAYWKSTKVTVEIEVVE